MDWSPDYCLSCDRQISQSGHGAYCSQSCRLADLERASCRSGSSSPQAGASSSPSWSGPNMGSGAGFYLPPPLNFSAISGRQTSSAASSPTTRSPLSSTPPLQYSSSPYASNSTRSSGLYTSPSRTSLSSLQSINTQEPAVLSDKVTKELRDYASSFDHVRDWKRRMTVV